MEKQEPLNVRVAQALGLKVHAVASLGWDVEMGCWVELPDYANDPTWAVMTCEWNELEVRTCDCETYVAGDGVEWSEFAPVGSVPRSSGTFCRAVAGWVCAAFAAGVEIKQGGAK
jgi:hypothetical protein